MLVIVTCPVPPSPGCRRGLLADLEQMSPLVTAQLMPPADPLYVVCHVQKKRAGLATRPESVEFYPDQSRFEFRNVVCCNLR